MMQFAHALTRRGDEVDVIALRQKGLSKSEVVNGVNVLRIQSRTYDERLATTYLLKLIGFHLRATWLLMRRHLERPYQVIHVQSVPDFLVFTAIFPKLLGAKVILDFRDLVPELYASKFNVNGRSLTVGVLLLVERLSAAFADHVIIANPVWYERIVSRAANREKCTMIWYYPDLLLFASQGRRRTNDRFVIMYPGTLNWHQGVDVAVKALPKILEKVPQAEFQIYGDGPTKQELKSLVKKLNLSDKVKMSDGVPFNEIMGLMADSDVAVVPKRAGCVFGNEAASTKISEFMALGVPVVASRTKVESCFFDDSQLCYFRSEDEEDLARAVVSLYEEPELRNRLVAAGLKYIKQNNWEIKKDDYLKMVDHLVNGQKAGPSQRREP
jgi:glycosyltransferase involved in cell wall biosynthesis